MHPANRQALDAENAKKSDDANAPKISVFQLYCSRSVVFPAFLMIVSPVNEESCESGCTLVFAY